jgi:hypothetical protein
VVLFASHLSLTGRVDGGFQELFRYVAGVEGGPGLLVCVSCSPGGTPASGEALLAGEGSFDEHPATEFWLARNLSGGGGRVFFVSNEGLVPGAREGEPNVFEWEADGEGSCESEAEDEGCLFLIAADADFLDASVSGDDVFFLTREQLVAGDTDSSVDVYDAHACDPETEECEKLGGRGVCSGEGCLGAPGAPPVLAGPASSSLTGGGNLPPAQPVKPATTKPEDRAEKLAAALKACKRKPRRKRRACETAARKRYGAKPKPGASKKAAAGKKAAAKRTVAGEKAKRTSGRAGR